MSDIPTLSAMVGETRGELSSLAHSMAALMADPQSKAADRRLATMNRRMGRVTAVQNVPLFPLTATVEVNGTAIPGCSPQSTYRPQIGDLVWLEFLGADPHISPPLTTVANRQWNPLTLNSPWAIVDTGGWSLPPTYWMDPGGIVHFRGSVKNGAGGSTIATLPLGYRPVGQHGYSVFCYDSASSAAVGQVVIPPDGALVYIGPTTPVHVALDGITFRID